MPSKREGKIQPSVTSQPPRFTAFTLREPIEEERSLAGLVQEERETRHEPMSIRRSHWKRDFPPILFVLFLIFCVCVFFVPCEWLARSCTLFGLYLKIKIIRNH